jgi:hypothetical protein
MTTDLEPTLGEMEAMGALAPDIADLLDARHAGRTWRWRDLTRTELARKAGDGKLAPFAIATYTAFFGQEWKQQAIAEAVAELGP